MNHSRILFITCITAILFQWSCSDAPIQEIDEQNFEPVIEAAIPDSAYIGDIVTIVGKNFSTDTSIMEVSFTGSPAKILSATPTELEVMVPYEASSSSGILYVTVNEVTAASEFGFKVIHPGFSVYNMNPWEGSAGQRVRLNGSDLPSDPSEIKATFNDSLEAEVVYADGYYVDVIVPHGATTGPFLLEINGRLAISPGKFHYIHGGKWERIAEFPNGYEPNGQAGFVIGDRVFVGLGSVTTHPVQDFYELNPKTFELVKKNNFPGTTRMGPFSFSYNGKGYIAGGFYGYYGGYGTDFWRYEPGSDSWEQLPDFPGEGRGYGVTFQIGAKAYVGLGRNNTTGKLKDFWEYDFATETWTQLEDFPGAGREGAGFFVIDGKGYVFGGQTSNGLSNDLWEFNPSGKTWTRKADAEDIAPRAHMVSFSINNKGYIAAGWDYEDLPMPRETFRYDPATDSWDRRSNFYDYETSYVLSLPYQDKAFVFTGNYNRNYYVFTDEP
ncbi:Kelch repeat-containing protein [Nafulsella turpanensis]|uniref:Kelch repeat-containing protein n=1 Tax=Nafulsella turpanensis TaxID=1265690 RepID=UPI000346C86A|nr:kelch repeat-containing protein [Nafulsella turpanensis]